MHPWTNSYESHYYTLTIFWIHLRQIQMYSKAYCIEKTLLALLLQKEKSHMSLEAKLKITSKPQKTNLLKETSWPSFHLGN